jgi:urea transporter
MASRSTYRENAGYFIKSIFNSYSQIFFSSQRFFALLLLVVTFMDVYAGLAGFIAVLTTSLTAFVVKVDKPTTAKGFYGFNSLLVGLGLGIYYAMSWPLVLIIVLASVFTFLISVSLQGVIGKYHLPYLSIPFLIALWTFMLATGNFEALGISERGIYTLNELYKIGGKPLVDLHETVSGIELPKPLAVYFISLSAILFQYSVLSGIIIAIGLLFYSRIAFTLSLLGFFTAYLFYALLGANITQVDYSYIGFNYILTAIALGGFFLIPSARTYAWVIILIPLVAIITISLNSILITFKLPVYSLPFNLVVLLFIYSLKFRPEYSYRLTEVYYQHNFPEKNLYIFLNNKDRFRYKLYTQVKLPFLGTWTVSQGHDGEYTHQKDWRHAWDFVITDHEGKQYRKEGDFPEDYFCFGKPVIAPEDGVVEKIVDDIPDNIIGEVNLENNWGNTLILKHDDEIYTKLSHLRKGSLKVREGEKVKFGQVVAECGNSGRSPYPHLHFQVQETPYIGSTTLDYPISAFIEHDGSDFRFHSHKRPQKDQKVSNIEANELLANAFNFIPGQRVAFAVERGSGEEKFTWEVKVNPYNETYIYCEESGAMAYFERDDRQFYFTSFQGRKDCYLFYFYLSCFKVEEGFYQDLILNDRYPLHLVFPRIPLWFHDFISPFFQPASSNFTLKYADIDDYMAPEKIRLESTMENYLGSRRLKQTDFNVIIDTKGIQQITVQLKNETITMSRCDV